MAPPNLPHEATTVVVDLPGGDALALLRPARPEALLDAVSALDADERLPYWGELWPSSLALAWAIAEGRVDVRGCRVTELGCGLALSGLAAARAGAGRVLVTDWYEDCLAFARESARLNGLTVEALKVDWRAPPEWAQAELVLAADVLYERRNALDVAAALRALVSSDGRAVIADPGRTYLPHLLAELSDWSCERERVSVTSPHIPQGQATIELLTFRRPPGHPPGRR